MSDDQVEPASIDRTMPDLPAELFQKIVDHLAYTEQMGTLAKLLLLSQDVYNTVGPSLYRELVVTRKNAQSIYRGLPTPTSRLRRRREVPDRGITWAEFRHPNHYLDWAASVDWGHNENLRRKRYYLVWPDGDMESDDSSHEDEEGWSAGQAYPTRQSALRKQALLSQVVRLHFEEIPSWDICRSLHNLTQSGSSGPMGRLKHVSLRPRAIWRLIDWTDRHRGQDHPFLHYFRHLTADHLCVQMPTVDRHLEKAYMLKRIVPLDQHASRQGNLDQFAFLRRELRRLVLSQYDSIIDTIRGSRGWAVRSHMSVTVHNSVTDLPRGMTENAWRIFYRPCSCLDPSVTDKVDDYFCYNHLSGTATYAYNRINYAELRDLSSKVAVRSVELIDVDWTAGRNDAPRDDRVNQGLRQSIESTNSIIVDGEELPGEDMEKQKFLEKVIRTTYSDKASPCGCCGQKQLTGRQSTIK